MGSSVETAPGSARDADGTNQLVPVGMRYMCIEIYQGPIEDACDDVIVIDMTPPEMIRAQACAPSEVLVESTSVKVHGIRMYRDCRNTKATGGVVNIYI